MRKAQQADVKGIKIQISGRLNGAEIARSEWVREGQVPFTRASQMIPSGVTPLESTWDGRCSREMLPASFSRDLPSIPRQHVASDFEGCVGLHSPRYLQRLTAGRCMRPWYEQGKGCTAGSQTCGRRAHEDAEVLLRRLHFPCDMCLGTVKPNFARDLHTGTALSRLDMHAGLRSTRLRWRVLYPQTYPQCTHGKEKWGKMGENGGKWGKMGENGEKWGGNGGKWGEMGGNGGK